MIRRQLNERTWYGVKLLCIRRNRLFILNNIGPLAQVQIVQGLCDPSFAVHIQCDAKPLKVKEATAFEILHD